MEKFSWPGTGVPPPEPPPEPPGFAAVSGTVGAGEVLGCGLLGLALLFALKKANVPGILARQA